MFIQNNKCFKNEKKIEGFVLCNGKFLMSLDYDLKLFPFFSKQFDFTLLWEKITSFDVILLLKDFFLIKYRLRDDLKL